MADPSWTTYVQTASWAAGAVTAMIGVYKFGQDNLKAREQRRVELEARRTANETAARELEWRQAAEAQTLLEAMEDDEPAANAMLMLDWDGRDFQDGKTTRTISTVLMLRALRVSGPQFDDDDEIYVRDAFDHLFWYFERIDQAVEIELILLKHVRFPLGYLIALMERNRGVFEAYLQAYNYTGSLDLIGRFRALGLPLLNLPPEFTTPDGTPAQTARPTPRTERPSG